MRVSMNLNGKQQGLSLIELMIALALGLVLILGVMQVFIDSSKTHRLTDSIAKLQENLRYSLSTLSYETRVAGHYGCLVGPPANQLDTTDGAYEPMAYEGNAVMGWGFDGTSLDDGYTIESLNLVAAGWSNGTGDDLPADLTNNDSFAVPGTDILLVNNARPLDIEVVNGAGTTISTSDVTGVEQGTVVVAVAGDCSGGDLFQNTNDDGDSSVEMGSGGAPGNAGASLSDYDADAVVYEHASTIYYVGEGAGGEPALFRDRLDAGDEFDAVELVDGVENMQVLYGLHTSGIEPQAQEYVPSSGVTDWSQVVSVRIALLMRSSDSGADEAAAGVFNLNGTEITTQSDRRARLVGNSTIAIRNRLD